MSKHVVFFGIDGAQWSRVEKLMKLGKISGFESFYRQEAYTGGENPKLKEQETKSGPGWSSLLTGTWAQDHGISFNNEAPVNPDTSSVFDRVRDALPDADIDMHVRWTDLANFYFKDEYTNVANSKKAGGPDKSHTELTISRIENGGSTFIFDQYLATDQIGHEHGSGPEYDKALIDAFAALLDVYSAIQKRMAAHPDEEWLLIAATDHGRDAKGKDHGGQTGSERQSFFLSNQPLVSSEKPVPVTSLVPTIMDFLDLEYDRTEMKARSLLKDDDPNDGTCQHEHAPVERTMSDPTRPLNGGAGDDVLRGGQGNDEINAGSGRDTVFGGAGDDVIHGNFGSDNIMGGSGRDTIYGDDSDDLIDGGDGDDILYGGDGDDTLQGGNGNDTLDGNGGEDRMKGGGGDDVYHITGSDSVREEQGEGIDTVHIAGNYRLRDNFENLVLEGKGKYKGEGNALDNKLIGNDADNVLSGLDGNDVLLGGKGNDTLNGGNGKDRLDGGEGKDILVGGDGDDTYVYTFEDEMRESDNGGFDTVIVSGNYTLQKNFEGLILGGTKDFSGTGNEVGNEISGNSGANLLKGLAGNDTLRGNAGDDILDGGDGDDTLYGGDGDDTLKGGAGKDTLKGGKGNDTYYFEEGDVMIEDPNGGIDTVHVSSNHVLNTNFENLILDGNGNFSGTGNSLANEIRGNGGNNILKGNAGNDRLFGAAGDDVIAGGDGDDWLDGGLGHDRLTGGSGKDSFVFGAAFQAASKTTKGASAATIASASDIVTDFTKGDDTIVLSRSCFSALNQGDSLSAKGFLLGNGKATSATRIIYDVKTGNLFYDADGSGTAHDKVLIATITTSGGNHPALAVSDFQLIA